jgi:hypothetical protein
MDRDVGEHGADCSRAARATVNGGVLAELLINAGRRPTTSAPALAPGQDPGDPGDPARKQKPGRSGTDQRLALVDPQLATPIGEPDDLGAQLGNGSAKLAAVRLDRATDLFG